MLFRKSIFIILRFLKFYKNKIKIMKFKFKIFKKFNFE